MPHPFRFSAAMPPLTQSVSAWRAELRRIEDLGYSAVAISDHFTKGWVMEPVVAMTAAAEATRNLRLLSLVLSNDYRHPALLQKALATLDVLSGGRVEIGLGAGWLESEYAAANIPFDPPGVRVDRLAESVDVIKGLFGPEPFNFVGKHYQIRDLDGLPKPVQAPHPPLLIGGGGRRMLELAGTVADIVGLNTTWRRGAPTGSALLDLTGDRVAAKVAIARAAARAAGRDPESLRFQTAILSLNLTDVPGARPWVSSMAADVTDPAGASRVARGFARQRGILRGDTPAPARGVRAGLHSHRRRPGHRRADRRPPRRRLNPGRADSGREELGPHAQALELGSDLDAVGRVGDDDRRGSQIREDLRRRHAVRGHREVPTPLPRIDVDHSGELAVRVGEREELDASGARTPEHRPLSAIGQIGDLLAPRGPARPHAAAQSLDRDQLTVTIRWPAAARSPRRGPRLRLADISMKRNIPPNRVPVSSTRQPARSTMRTMEYASKYETCG